MLTSMLLAGCGSERSLRDAAAAYRGRLAVQQRVGEIVFPSGAVTTVRAGLTKQNLDRGDAAWYAHSKLPGEGGMIYIAGHRTTHGAPFAPVALLHRGDTLTFNVPYGKADYMVMRRVVVDETDRGILSCQCRREQLRLQTSTVPASSKRLVVLATLLRIVRRVS